MGELASEGIVQKLQGFHLRYISETRAKSIDLCIAVTLVTLSPTFGTVSPIGNVSSSSVSMPCSRNAVGGMFPQECFTELWLSTWT